MIYLIMNKNTKRIIIFIICILAVIGLVIVSIRALGLSPNGKSKQPNQINVQAAKTTFAEADYEKVARKWLDALIACDYQQFIRSYDVKNSRLIDADAKGDEVALKKTFYNKCKTISTENYRTLKFYNISSDDIRNGKRRIEFFYVDRTPNSEAWPLTISVSEVKEGKATSELLVVDHFTYDPALSKK